MIRLWPIFALAAAGAAGWTFAVVLLLAYANARARERLAWRQVAEMRREREAGG